LGEREFRKIDGKRREGEVACRDSPTDESPEASLPRSDFSFAFLPRAADFWIDFSII
jgi:hypothetical protein